MTLVIILATVIIGYTAIKGYIDYASAKKEEKEFYHYWEETMEEAEKQVSKGWDSLRGDDSGQHTVMA